MSGEELALRVGYKNQSSIGNLENRAGGTGGTQIGKIADALCVPVDWLLRGPDSDEVPYLAPLKNSVAIQETDTSTIPEKAKQETIFDSIQQEAIDLLSRMSPAGKEQSLSYLRYMAIEHPLQKSSAGGESHSIPHQKAA